jgi:hypothetical protein
MKRARAKRGRLGLAAVVGAAEAVAGVIVTVTVARAATRIKQI